MRGFVTAGHSPPILIDAEKMRIVPEKTSPGKKISARFLCSGGFRATMGGRKEALS